MEGPEKNSGPSFTLLVFCGEPLDSEEPVCHDMVSLYHTESSAGMIGGGASIWSSWMYIAGGGVLILLVRSPELLEEPLLLLEEDSSSEMTITSAGPTGLAAAGGATTGGAATIGSKPGGYMSGPVEAVEEGEGGGDTLLPVDSMGARETGVFLVSWLRKEDDGCRYERGKYPFYYIMKEYERKAIEASPAIMTIAMEKRVTFQFDGTRRLTFQRVAPEITALPSMG